MNAIIVDDEINAIKSLCWEIEHFVPDIHIIKTFESPETAVDYLENGNQPDIVFLDIQMPEMSGLEFIRRFPNREFQVIFTTAYSEFALEALKNEALDYLMKPIDSDDLIRAVNKMKKRNKTVQISDKLEKTIKAIGNTDAQKEKIKITHDKKVEFYEPHEIIYFSANGNYTKIHLQNRPEVLMSLSLKDVMDLLPEKHFFRIHKSYIVNVHKITSFLKTENYIQLNNKITVPLARNRKQEFISKYL